MHATGVTAARCVAALAPRCAFSLPLPFRFGVTTHFLTRAMRATEPRVGANAPPATAHTSDLRCPIPVFAKTQMRADGARRLPARTRRTSPGGCVPQRLEATIPSKTRDCLPVSRTFTTSLVTPRHAASFGSPTPALSPADARYPEIQSHDTSRRFAYALARLPARPRARGGRPRHVHGCVPRPLSIVSPSALFQTRISRDFSEMVVFGDCFPYTLARDT